MTDPIQRINEYLADPDTYKRNIKDVLKELRARIYQDQLNDLAIEKIYINELPNRTN